MWDFDKLFAEGNIVGLKNLHNNKIYNHGIPNKNCWGDTNEVDWYCFENNNLKRNMLEIQYIIRLDEHGNVVEKLFDRDTDMPKPMPKLETGMFVRVYTQTTKTYTLAVVYEDRIIYQTGEWDDICDVLSEDDLNMIVEIYPSNVLCFDRCSKENAIWSRSEH